jgi:hypothetical protein
MRFPVPGSVNAHSMMIMMMIMMIMIMMIMIMMIMIMRMIMMMMIMMIISITPSLLDGLAAFSAVSLAGVVWCCRHVFVSVYHGCTKQYLQVLEEKGPLTVEPKYLAGSGITLEGTWCAI